MLRALRSSRAISARLGLTKMGCSLALPLTAV